MVLNGLYCADVPLSTHLLIFSRGKSLRRALPSPENCLLFDLKKEHFGAVFKLDLMEETRTQLQEEEDVIASSCLILATCMHLG